MHLPLYSEECEKSNIEHEKTLYGIRDWYMRKHGIIRLRKDGTDRELIEESEKYIFPCKLKSELNHFITLFLVELALLPEINYHVRIFAMSGRNANVEHKDVNFYPANTRWITTKNAQVLRQHWHVRFFTNPL